MRSVPSPTEPASSRPSCSGGSPTTCRCDSPGSSPPRPSSQYVTESYRLLAQHAKITRYLPSLTARFAADRLRSLADADGLEVDATPDVLFVCVQNAGRSQMASAILRSLAGDRVRVLTAGSEPSPTINPLIVTALDEIGVPSAASSRSH